MKRCIGDFIIKKCDVSCINQILDIQEEVLHELEGFDILRRNSEQMLRECLESPHITLGAWYGDLLTAFSILYFPHTTTENLSMHLKDINVRGLITANNKLCIVRKEFRGNSLQYEMGCRLEKYAKEKNVNLICTTVAPENLHSENNMKRLGFIYNRTLMRYGSERCLFYKFI